MRRVLVSLLLCASLAAAGDSTMPGQRIHVRVLNTSGLWFDPVTHRLGHNTRNPGASIDWIEDQAIANVRLTSYGVSKGVSFNGQYARGTLISPSASQSGDVLFQLAGCGHDGTTFCGFIGLPDVQMALVADATWTTSSHPSRIEEYTTPSGSTTRALARTTGSDGSQKFLGHIMIDNASAPPTNSVSIDGESNRTIWMERRTGTTNTGNNLTVQAGGAAATGSNKAGGNLLLSSGTSTGSGTSNVQVQAFPGTAGATSDNTVVTIATFNSTGLRVGDATAPTNPFEVDGKFIVSSSGVATTYNNVAKDSNHNGMPFVVASATKGMPL